MNLLVTWPKFLTGNHKPLKQEMLGGREKSLGFAESDYATLIVPADGGEKKKMEENNKKGDSKGSGRAEPGAGGKEGTTSGANGTKIKQEGGDGGSKRLVSLIELKSTVRSTVVQQTGNVSLTTLLGMFYCCITVSSG